MTATTTTITVKLGNVWCDDALDRELDIGTVVRRTKRLTTLEMTPEQLAEAISAADYDEWAFGVVGS